MTSDIHRFDNGILIEAALIIPLQRARYAVCNIHEPEEEAWFRRLLATPQQGAPVRFLDIGAGVGYYGILVAQLRPDAQVTAFEPLPQHADAILRHWALNGLSPDRLTLHRVAASDVAGVARFVFDQYASHLEPGGNPVSPAVQTVATARLDSYLNAMAAGVDLIKIDVQGAEMAVLSGCGTQARKVRDWIVGTHGGGIHRQVASWFHAQGAEILCDAATVNGQPDGLVIARFA